MIEFSSNISDVIKEKLAQLQSLGTNTDPVLRTVALTVLPELKQRVHRDGKDSEGNQIGTYSPGYMKVRTGDYKNSAKISRGENKGKLKDAGKFTKGTNIKVFGTIVEDTPKAGLNRPRYNRGPETKVILSLTRQMENDTSVIQTENGYGIGYLNPFNFQKAMWCEATYKKPILTKLTKEETELAAKVANEETQKYLNSN